MTEREAARIIARQPAILPHAGEVTGKVARTCGHYASAGGCSTCGKRRFEDEGLEDLRDRSSRPKHSPRATRTEVVSATVEN